MHLSVSNAADKVREDTTLIGTRGASPSPKMPFLDEMKGAKGDELAVRVHGSRVQSKGIHSQKRGASKYDIQTQCFTNTQFHI